MRSTTGAKLAKLQRHAIPLLGLGLLEGEGGHLMITRVYKNITSKTKGFVINVHLLPLGQVHHQVD